MTASPAVQRSTITIPKTVPTASVVLFTWAIDQAAYSDTQEDKSVCGGQHIQECGECQYRYPYRVQAGRRETQLS